MNFFGHAVVAGRHSPEPAFVLGAMLPDFATMLGARVPPVTHAGLERGVAFHHRTDHVFHDAPTFRTLQAAARAELRALGLPRPGALAVGHIGVELLLDAVLAADVDAADGYLVALAHGGPDHLGGHIGWTAPEVSLRYEGLRSVLVERGVPRRAVHGALVAERITRALSPRPRLRLSVEGERIVSDWAVRALPAVAAAAPALMGEVGAGLSA